MKKIYFLFFVSLLSFFASNAQGNRPSAPCVPTNNVYSIVACNQFAWHGDTYFESGDYTYSYDNESGCPSVDTLHLRVVSTTNLFVEVTSCDSYSWHGETYTESGDYYKEYYNSNGCLSLDTLRLTINLGITTEYPGTTEGCDSLTIDWGDTSATFYAHGSDTSGTWLIHDTTEFGCDNDRVAHFTIYTHSVVDIDTSACESLVLPWSDIADSTGTYSYNYNSASIHGCDSIVNYHITIFHSNDTTISPVQNCDTFYFPAEWQIDPLTSDTTIYHTFSNVHGCDSVVKYEVTINHSVYRTVDTARCTRITLHGTRIDESRTFEYHVPRASNCDSIIIYNVTITNKYRLPEVEGCDSVEVVFGDTSYFVNQTRDYIKRYTNITGTCNDSIVLIHAVVHHSNQVAIDTTVCNGMYLPWGGSLVDSSGSFSYTYSNEFGCDSVVTYNVTVNYSSYSTPVIVSACDDFYVLPWGDTAYLEIGFIDPAFTHMYQNIHGCDSLVTYIVHFNKPYLNSLDEINQCDSVILPWGVTVYETGDYSRRYHMINNNTYPEFYCDSIVSVHVNITNHFEGEPVFGCDSVLLTFGTDTSYYVYQSGTYEHRSIRQGECDNVLRIHATINNSTYLDVRSECDSARLPWGEYIYASAGGFEFHTVNQYGCDSVVYSNITVNYSTSTSYSAVGCDSLVLPWGTVAHSTDSYSHTYSTVNGCDSVVTAQVTINQSSAPSTELATACGSFELPWGETASASGLYPHTYSNVSGCDSIVTYDVTIKPLAQSSFSASNCDSYELPWGETVTESGIYPHTYDAAGSNGCDSVVTADITVNHNSSSATDVTVIGFYSWNGTEYTNSGTYYYPYTSGDGCPSVDTLRLTIIPGNVLVTPNPSTGVFYVTYMDRMNGVSSPSQLTIYDSKGARVYNAAFPHAFGTAIRMRVDLSNHPSGVYHIEVTDAAGERLQTGKAIIAK